MKLKDLPPNTDLRTVKYKGKRIASAWNKGLWLRVEGSTQVIPEFFESTDQMMDIEVEI